MGHAVTTSVSVCFALTKAVSSRRKPFRLAAKDQNLFARSHYRTTEESFIRTKTIGGMYTCNIRFTFAVLDGVSLAFFSWRHGQ